MDEARARARLLAERAEVQDLLARTEAAWGAAWPPWAAPSSGSRAGPTAGPSAAGGRFPRSGWRPTPPRNLPSKRPRARRPRPGPETSIDARAGHGPPPR